MTREETSKYTEVMKGGKARQFSFVIDARSIITSPSYPQKMRRGWNEIRGIAWSGRGKIVRAELSFDEGRTWHTTTELQNPCYRNRTRGFVIPGSGTAERSPS